jgi:hypothetical protein
MAPVMATSSRKKERKKGVWAEGEYLLNICHITMDVYKKLR